MKHAATYKNFNVMVRHDLSNQGQHHPSEYLFHSAQDAYKKAKQLRRNNPYSPVHVMNRAEVEAERRADDEYSQQDCS